MLNSINPETDGVSLAEYLSYYRKVADEIDAKRAAFVSLSNAARSEGEEMFAWWQALSEEDKVKFQTFRDSWKQPDFVQQFLAQFQAMFDGVAEGSSSPAAYLLTSVAQLRALQDYTAANGWL